MASYIGLEPGRYDIVLINLYFVDLNETAGLQNMQPGFFYSDSYSPLLIENESRFPIDFFDHHIIEQITKNN